MCFLVEGMLSAVIESGPGHKSQDVQMTPEMLIEDDLSARWQVLLQKLICALADPAPLRDSSVRQRKGVLQGEVG